MPITLSSDLSHTKIITNVHGVDYVDLERLIKDMKRTLGCNGTIMGDTIKLQTTEERVREYLTTKGLS